MMQRDRRMLNACLLATLVALVVAGCVPVPTPTPLPSPTLAPTPAAINTAVPTPSNTPLPPTSTTTPQPTATPAKLPATATTPPTATAVPSATATTKPSATPTAAATAAPTTGAAGQPAVNATVTQNTCLACHGPLEKLVKASPNYAIPDGTKVNPHITIDYFAKKPHASSEGVIECTKCHTPHLVPLASAKDMPKADVTYCFSCHHEENFTPCSECH
jgi:predicted CXXCH cytochrome family protein